MIRENFKAIAEIMKAQKEIADNNVVDAAWIVSDTVYCLSRYFEKQNALFEPVKFREACGYGGE